MKPWIRRDLHLACGNTDLGEQYVLLAYRFIGHGGSIYGYLSDLKWFPDLRMGIFMSSTNDISSPDWTAYLTPGIVDILLNQPKNFFTAANLCKPTSPSIICGNSPRPTPTAPPGFNETCLLPNIQKYCFIVYICRQTFYVSSIVRPGVQTPRIIIKSVKDLGPVFEGAHIREHFDVSWIWAGFANKYYPCFMRFLRFQELCKMGVSIKNLWPKWWLIWVGSWTK